MQENRTEFLIELTEDELKAVAGGVGTVSLSFSGTASGTTATVTATATANTTPSSASGSLVGSSVSS